ncbi:PREDICTED: uncharacterized protein LOC108381993, partial [Rhagoletis zephyria]|uniref:uncharacterized protein LOC108381993 n=1 Tax=Rhagoletis zephyria TaxID=28612 RepID=UPI0008113B25
ISTNFFLYPQAIACILVQCALTQNYDKENRRLILQIKDQKTTNQQYYSSNFDTSK